MPPSRAPPHRPHVKRVSDWASLCPWAVWLIFLPMEAYCTARSSARGRPRRSARVTAAYQATHLDANERGPEFREGYGFHRSQGRRLRPWKQLFDEDPVGRKQAGRGTACSEASTTLTKVFTRVEFDSVEDASPKGVGKIGSRATSLPRWPDRPAHLSTQIPGAEPDPSSSTPHRRVNRRCLRRSWNRRS